MASAAAPEKQVCDDILSKIHSTLNELSSLPHANNNPQHPNPNFHLDIFGRPRYTKIRRVRRPDGHIVDEDWKAPRVGKPWPPPPEEYIKPSRRQQTLDQSSIQQKTPKSPSIQRVRLDHSVDQGNSAIVSDLMVGDSAQDRATNPPRAMDLVETDTTDIDSTNSVEGKPRRKQKAISGTYGILFPREEEMPGYIPPHLRAGFKSVTTPSKRPESRESSPGLETSRWAPKTKIRATTFPNMSVVKQVDQSPADTHEASIPAESSAAPVQSKDDGNTATRLGGARRLRILRITNVPANTAVNLGGHGNNWSSKKTEVTETAPAPVEIPPETHLYSIPRFAPASRRQQMGKHKKMAANADGNADGEIDNSNMNKTAPTDGDAVPAVADTIPTENASTAAASLTIPAQDKNDTLIPISPSPGIKHPVQSMPKKELPPVSIMTFKPVPIMEAAPLAKDKSLSSEPVHEEPKAKDGWKPDTWKEDTWADNKPQKKSAWAKIRNTKPLAEYLTKDDDGWDPPFRITDPNDVSHLLDWKGDWLPAPADWEGRARYADDDEIKKWALWVDKTEHALTPELKTDVKYRGSEITVTKNSIYIDHHAYLDGTHEIVPRYWIPEKIEAQSLQAFFTSFIRSSSPPSYEETEEDPPSAPEWTPFWARYKIDGLPYNEIVPVPDYKMDQKDENYDVYLTDTGTPDKITSYVLKYAYDGGMLPKKRKSGNGKSKKHRGDFNAAPAIPLGPPVPDAFDTTRHSSKLKVNIYLRVAKACDDKQIADIYNYYVANTVQAAELQPRTVAAMYARRDLAENDHHKCIVAVEKTNGRKKSAGARGGPTLLSMEEKIVGYAMADDFTASDSMYRYTAELELFVHPDYVRKGVGSTLLDRMLFLLDPAHKISTNADWRERTVDLVNPGAIRYTQNITMSVPFVFEEDDERMRWMEAWLNSFDFHKKGEWDRVGVKLTKWVNLALFQKRTGATVNPRNAL